MSVKRRTSNGQPYLNVNGGDGQGCPSYETVAVAELRTDWLSGRWVLVAENRAERPNEFGDSGELAFAGGSKMVAHLPPGEAGPPTCPFCLGQEHRTPPAVYEQRDEQGRWRVRVVPNKYPAVTLGDFPIFLPTDEIGRPGDDQAGTVPFGGSVAAFGAHEVIIEAARHVDRMSALSLTELGDVLAAYAARLRHWRDDGRFHYGLVFKNQGPRAGASLVHLHSQMIALPIVPPAVCAELRRGERFFQEQHFCPLCRLVEQERAAGDRIVLDREGYVAFCPFASWQPYEVWLLPAEHEPSFERPRRPDAHGRLASVLQALVGKVELVVPHAAYNLVLQTAPWGAGADDRSDWCHWRIEILPRSNVLAGLELAAGVHINPLAPERAAGKLRPI